MWKRSVMRVCLFLFAGAIVNVAVAWGLAIFVNLDLERGQTGRLSSESETWFVTCKVAFGATRIDPLWWSGGSDFSTESNDFMLKVYANVIADEVPSWSVTQHGRPASVDRSLPDHELVQAIILNESLNEDARGWPMLSMRSSFDVRTIAWRNNLELGGIRATEVGVNTATLFHPDVGEVPGPRYILPDDGVRHGILFSAKQLTSSDIEIRTLPLLPIWPGFAINTIFYAGVLWMLFAFPFALRRHVRRKRNLCPACAYPVGTSEFCTECGAALNPRLSPRDRIQLKP